MYIARIKYSRCAIPEEVEFASREDAEAHCKNKDKNNPYVRWTEVDTERKYPVENNRK